MQSTVRRASLLIAGIAAAGAPSVFGQESLRSSLEQDRVNSQRAKSFKSGHYNLKLGPVLFNTSAGSSVSYNDNINIAPSGFEQDDLIIRPTANLGVLWQVTEYNRLSLDVSVGYAKYINHPENDRVTLAPGSLSDISYDFSISSFRLNLHDRFAYTQDPLAYGTGAVSGQADLGRIRNSAGMSAMLPVKDGSVSAGYDHVNYLFLTPGFENSDYSSEIVFARYTYQWNPTLQVGVEVSGGMTDYSQAFRSDNRNYTVGPHMDWMINSAFRLEARTGLSGYDLINVGGLGDVSAPLSFYASLELSHRVNQRITQTLSLGQDTSQGVGISSNFLETMYARHSATFNVFNHVSFSTQLFVEHSSDSSEGTGVFLSESYTRYGGGFTLGYQLMERLAASLSYLHTEKTSNIGIFDFSQNSVTLGMSYHF